MDWIGGPKPEKPVVDVNRLLKAELKGELTEEQARVALGRLFAHNIGFATRTLTSWILEPYQRIVIKGWLTRNYSLTVASRGFAKSFLFSHFCYLYCIMNPGKHIVMVSATFRSSRKILETIDAWSQRKKTEPKNGDRGDSGGTLLRQCFDGDMVKKQDMYVIKFKNGSSITALPLGDPEKLRGFRCSVLGIDEGLLIPQTTMDNVLKPFLIAVPPEETLRRQKIREKERAKIKAGTMKPEDQQKFDSQVKMVILSSASYTWQDLYKTYKTYLKIITADPDVEAEKLDGKPATYLVHQLSYRLANPDMMDKAVIKEINSGMYSEITKKREYEAQFTQDSDGYFSARKMADCTIPDGEEPCIEIVGEEGAEYVLGIDQNSADTETADHFAMCVIKRTKRKMSDGEIRDTGLVVHQYADAGASLEEHIAYLDYVLTYFNVVYIICDNSQGSNTGFTTIANTNDRFKQKKIALKPLDADFGRASEEDIKKQVRKSYNRQDKRIVQPQGFHSDFQRAANEQLQIAFDRKNISFASKWQSQNDAVIYRLQSQDIGDIAEIHSSFAKGGDVQSAEKGSKGEFIEHQDTLMDLVKTECALIEMKANASGHLSWDIPQHLKRGNKNVNRTRRDSYTALLLANWGLYIYNGAMNLPQEPAETEGFFVRF